MTEVTDKQPVDWVAIEKHYRAGIKSLRTIGEEYGVTEGAIRKRAKRDDWARGVAVIDRPKDRSVAIAEVVDEFGSAGFVYGIYFDAGGERYFKIGMAKSPMARLDSHQTSLPFEARIGIAYFVDNMREEERTLHAAFADKQVRGEWFRLDDSDLEFMASRARLV